MGGLKKREVGLAIKAKNISEVNWENQTDDKEEICFRYVYGHVILTTTDLLGWTNRLNVQLYIN
jgi:hypothetical protein